MDECRAKIIAEIGLTCASACSAIALHADEWVVYDSSTMMIHACSYSPGYGKESDVRLSVAYTERINREWVERTYAGFLTDEEFVQILDYGRDLYFHADDLRDRLPKYAAYRAEKEEQEMAEMKQYFEAQEDD
jgi:ATP-dependent protease ClpP protease subunit